VAKVHITKQTIPQGTYRRPIEQVIYLVKVILGVYKDNGLYKGVQKAQVIERVLKAQIIGGALKAQVLYIRVYKGIEIVSKDRIHERVYH
jgi:hypothetical protein